MKLKCLILVAALFFPSIALGDEWKPYASVGAGMSFFSSVDESHAFDKVDASFDGNFDLNTGFNVKTAYGFKLNSFRAELEYSYRRSSLDDFNGGFTSGADAFQDVPADIDGYLKSHAVMVNGYYKVFETPIFSPYLGLGIGWGWEKFKVDKASSSNPKAPKDLDKHQMERNKNGFAYQLMVGNTVKFTEKISGDIEYRHFELRNVNSEEVGVSLRYAF